MIILCVVVHSYLYQTSYDDLTVTSPPRHYCFDVYTYRTAW